MAVFMRTPVKNHSLIFVKHQKIKERCVDLQGEFTRFFISSCPLWLMITLWEGSGINDSWWVTTFRKTGSISRTI